MDDAFELQRFVTAQDHGGTYDRAVAELRQGRKQSHWMWFVFPQIAGLGHSPTSRRFAIASLAEATAYRAHPVLGARLLECTRVVADIKDRDAVEVFGGVDAQKLRSSMTLFSQVEPGELFAVVLERFFHGVPDPATELLL